MGVREDEAFKAAAHALVLGVILLPLAYNLHIRKWSNVLIYSALLGFETFHIVEHVKDIPNVLEDSAD